MSHHIDTIHETLTHKEFILTGVHVFSEFDRIWMIAWRKAYIFDGLANNFERTLNSRHNSPPGRNVKVNSAGGEPGLCSSEVTGFATSGTVGFTTETSIALAYIRPSLYGSKEINMGINVTTHPLDQNEQVSSCKSLIELQLIGFHRPVFYTANQRGEFA